MTIVEDTRNKEGLHSRKRIYFEEQGIKVVRSKLPAADYALLTDMSRVVDTKRNLQELVGNLVQDHERFKREADFCKEHGIELIVLIEEKNMHCLEDVLKWDNRRLKQWKKIKWMQKHGRWASVKASAKPPISNETLYKVMKTFGENHNVRWEFSNCYDAGKRVVELLMEGKDG